MLNLAYVLLLAIASPVLLYRALTQGKYRTGWPEKLLGLVPRRNSSAPCLWLHAVSVGEALQLQPVLEILTDHCPGYEFVISTTTNTAFELAKKKYSGHRVIYFPFDFTWAVRTALRRIRPTAVILVELELWPNFILAANDLKIPVALINGRISERSFRGYRKIRPLIARLLGHMSMMAVQNQTYAERLCALGADPARVAVTGSIKFDHVETNRNNPRTAELRRCFGLAKTDQVFIAGSTQAPEEQLALKAYQVLLKRHPNLRLILVPRHKERFDEVARLVTETYRLPLLRRSTGAVVQPQGVAECVDLPPIRLLDTLGELAACWGLADVAFVGGSLSTRGGQNMIEPAGYGAAVCFGPNTQNFRDVVDLLLQQDAAAVVRTGSELRRQVDWCLSNPQAAAERGDRARSLVRSQRGATIQTVEQIVSLLPTLPRAIETSSDIPKAA